MTELKVNRFNNCSFLLVALFVSYVIVCLIHFEWPNLFLDPLSVSGLYLVVFIVLAITYFRHTYFSNLSYDDEGLWYSYLPRGGNIVRWRDIDSVRDNRLAGKLILNSDTRNQSIAVRYATQDYNNFKEVLYEKAVQLSPAEYYCFKHYDTSSVASSGIVMGCLAIVPIHSIATGETGSSYLIYIFLMLALFCLHEIVGVRKIVIDNKGFQLDYVTSPTRFDFVNIKSVKHKTLRGFRGVWINSLEIYFIDGSEKNFERLGNVSAQVYLILKNRLDRKN